MNVLTAFLSRLTSRAPALILGCTAVGLLGGIVGGMIQFSRQKPVFESHMILSPSDSFPELSPKEWVEKEAAAMLQPENLEEAARRVNMETTHRMSVAECAALLKDSVSISTETHGHGAPQLSDPAPDAPGFPVLRVAMRGGDASECAAVVSAIVRVREDGWLKSEFQRLANDPRAKAARAKSAEISELFQRMAQLRKELVAGLPAAGLQDPDIHNPDISSDKLASLPLTGPLKKVQEDWLQVREAGNRYSSAGVITPPLHADPYAEVLEAPRASVDPIAPVWSTFGWPWISGGLGTGLLAGFIFYRMKAWKNVEGPAPDLPPATAAEF